MINIEELLTPVSPEEPCGADLAYDPAMLELDTALRGKPETQFSTAEEPRWDQLRDECVALLGRSKNLRVAVILCIALLRTEGLPGFRDGLAVIRGLLERYWDTLFPRLDPEDNNDPTERVNILSSMLTPLGSFDDPMQFLRKLREAPLANSPQLGRFGLEQISPSPGAAGQSGQPAADSVQVKAAFRDTPPEKLEQVMGAVLEATSTGETIDQFLTKTVGAGRAPDWAPLINTLKDIRKTLAPFVPQDVGGETVDGIQEGAAGPRKTGEIQSREDVMQMLDRLCDYYTRAEPSSPVPLLLRRAQRLVEANFLEIIGDLSPEALAPVQNATGVKPAAQPAQT